MNRKTCLGGEGGRCPRVSPGWSWQPGEDEAITEVETGREEIQQKVLTTHLGLVVGKRKEVGREEWMGQVQAPSHREPLSSDSGSLMQETC